MFLPGEFHGQRSLEGYSPWGHKIFRHNLVTKHHQESIQKSLVLLWRKRGFPGWVSPSHMSPLSLDVRNQRHLCKPESNSIQETISCCLWRWMDPCGKNLRVAFRSYWLKYIAVIFPAEKGLFGESRQLQLGVCNHCEPHVKCLHNKERILLQRRKEVGRDTVNKEFMAFHWLGSYRKNEESANVTRNENSPLSSPSSMKLRFLFIKIFTFPPFWSRSLWKYPWSESGFLVSGAFCL